MNDDDGLMYAALGPIAAIALGIVLIPFRDVTTASNFIFLFLVLTIVVAEFGGRWPAVATALASALSLDFFLTQPYLRLDMQDKHDILAFAGLTVCGLVVAAFAANRGERRSDLRAARAQRALLHTALGELDGSAELKYSAARLVDACQGGLPLTGISLLDNSNNVVHAATSSPQPAPVLALDAQLLLAPNQSERDLAKHALPLPTEGGRVPLMIAGRHVGWLDVWGGERPVDGNTRQTLADIARVAAALIATR